MHCTYFSIYFIPRMSTPPSLPPSAPAPPSPLLHWLLFSPFSSSFHEGKAKKREKSFLRLPVLPNLTRGVRNQDGTREQKEIKHFFALFLCVGGANIQFGNDWWGTAHGFFFKLHTTSQQFVCRALCKSGVCVCVCQQQQQQQ